MSVGNFVSKENPFDSYMRGEVYLELEDLRFPFLCHRSFLFVLVLRRRSLNTCRCCWFCRGFRISCRLPRCYGQNFINGLSRCHANIVICVVQFARLEYFEGGGRY